LAGSVASKGTGTNARQAGAVIARPSTTNRHRLSVIDQDQHRANGFGFGE